MRILPPREELVQLLGSDDFFLWEYYGGGVLSEIQGWIFRSRIKVVMRLMDQLHLQPKVVVDVGCGPMFITYALAGNRAVNYIGVDIMPTDRLKRYKDAIRKLGVDVIEVIRASAESLPFRNDIFDFALCLDVLEHLSKSREAAMEIYRTVKDDGIVAISLPLENLLQRLARVGFILMRLLGDTILKRAKHIPITRTPEYHYVGDVKSHDDMLKMLRGFFSLLYTRYTPIGFCKPINVNAVHIFKKNG
ncbi:MAG: class I SAM-dependent methyltransferase [Candidatus Brockarchaeota archaeon]|nr:class I SAM-dependent methyltransferase [Candidatus Brockarchaeota archaeon]